MSSQYHHMYQSYNNQICLLAVPINFSYEHAIEVAKKYVSELESGYEKAKEAMKANPPQEKTPEGENGKS